MKKAPILTMFLLALFTLTGCGGAAQETLAQTKVPPQTEVPSQNITILMGSGTHANSQAANLDAFAPYVREACKSENSTVTLIAVDGDPKVSATIVIPALPKGISAKVAERETNNRCQQILDLVGSLRASTPECDLLGALRLASRLTPTDSSRQDVLLIADPGLSTVDPLSMQNTILDERWNDEDYIDSVIADLQAQRVLPDLDGFGTCLWVGLGDTQLPQQDLSRANVEALQVFWRRALAAAGTDISFSDLPPVGSADNSEDLPVVSTVTVIDDISVFADAQVPHTGVVLTEETASFLPDSTEFRDRTQAEDALRSVADACCTKGAQYLICGQTATAGSEESCRDFSLERAEAVRDLLVEMGVPESSLRCIGVGYSSRLHVPDLAEDGISLLPEAAKKNRAVLLLPLDSSLAKALLQGE